MTLRGLLVVVMAVAAAGCGSEATGEGSQPEAPAGQSVPSIVTVVPGDHEPGEGFPMRSARDLTVVARNAVPDPSSLPFDATFPVSAGQPLVVFVSDPAVSEAVHDTLVDVEYDISSPYGAFRLREERTPVGLLESDFVQSVSHFCDEDGSSCTSALIDIGGNKQGALLYGPNGATSITAVETFDGQDYKLIVMGPGDTFTPARAEIVIREVIEGFHP